MKMLQMGKLENIFVIDVKMKWSKCTFKALVVYSYFSTHSHFIVHQEENFIYNFKKNSRLLFFANLNSVD